MKVSDLVKQLMEIKAKEEMEELESLPRRDVPEWFKNPQPLKEPESDVSTSSTSTNVVFPDFSRNKKPVFAFDGPRLEACAAPATEGEEREEDWLSVYMLYDVQNLNGLSYRVSIQPLDSGKDESKRYQIALEIEGSPDEFLDMLDEGKRYGLAIKAGDLELAGFEVTLDLGALMIIGEGNVYRATLPVGCIDDIDFSLYELGM